MIKDKQLLKYGKKIGKLMKINFNTKTTYGDVDDKYIKTKIKAYETNIHMKNVTPKYFQKNVNMQKKIKKLRTILIMN